ncbi:hypothetical protein HNO88_001096 [Novosphingobium chloroacetimidivorans]|uniref:Uncharacterized protein n=1 Tax=Novosphingobium chloroacetimidivorans TaxID=1428314 RepID=A0A7W7K7R3_9SPHN|nr:hypothetical protein [Novosphingobium chloroacetimidivorans]MBB4857785.1 hypothetical protein [Novosphingobium chloroacetimidivorans]
MADRKPDLDRQDIVPEQEDEDTQAQTVTDDAFGTTVDDGLEDSEKDKSGLEDFDAPDLVDRMKQMNSSGRIDMGAFDGEETMDDLENKYGSRNAADEDFAEDDS